MAVAVASPTAPGVGARSLVARLPVEPGVDRFRDVRGRALYIGRASDLRHRVGSYWSDLDDRPHLRRMVPRIAGIEAVVCGSAHEAAWLERNLLEASMPRWNRTAGGQEVPPYVLLDTGPRAPHLLVEHEHRLGRYPRALRFGPYLGGLRVRTAVAALDRILPLRYTGAGMTGGERDLGRHRGVTDADRDWMLDAAAAILGRHPDAVGRARAALSDLQDEAASALDFELAARIRDEAEALEWITGEQRATCDDASAGTIAGWSDGVLVLFGLTGGRISSWRSRPAVRAEAAPLVAATPPEWTAFAQRNADLAASLRRPAGIS
jgi:excinuclease ABC subunit C